MPRQFLLNFSGRAMGALLQAGAFVLLARSVSPREFGTVAVIVSVGLISAVIADAGLTSYIVKLVAIDRDFGAARTAMATSLALSTILLPVLVVGLVILPVGDRTPVWLPTMLFGAAAIEKYTETQLSVHIAIQRASRVVVSILIRRFTLVVSFAALTFLEINPILAFCLASLGGACAGQVHSHLILGQVPGLKSDPPAPVSHVLRKAAPFGVVNVTTQSRNFDVVVISLVSSHAQAGIYAAASKLASPFLLVGGALATSLMPALHPDQPRAQLRKFTLVFSLLPIALAGLSLACHPLGNPVMLAIYGDNYRETGSVLVWAATAVALAAFSSPLNAILQSIGDAKFPARTAMALAPTLLVGMAVAGSYGGAVSAAQAAAAVQTLWIAVLSQRCRRMLAS